MAKLHIGEISICYEGFTNKEGSYYGRSIVGYKRAELLRVFYDTKEAPNGYVVLAFNPERHITWEEVDWAGSSFVD